MIVAVLVGVVALVACGGEEEPDESFNQEDYEACSELCNEERFTHYRGEYPCADWTTCLMDCGLPYSEDLPMGGDCGTLEPEPDCGGVPCPIEDVKPIEDRCHSWPTKC